MFTWLAETSDFFSQVAHVFNWSLSWVTSLLSASSDCVNVFTDLSAVLPVELAWIIPMTMTAYAFHFIRGHL